jgi:two-component system NtrC family sensor kinase
VAEPETAPAPQDPDLIEPATLALLRIIAASADDAIIVTDLDARIQVWNAAADRLYGIAADEAIGRDIHDLTEATIVGEVDVPAWLPREIALATGVWHGRVVELPRIGRSVGREVVVEAALTRLVDEAGEVRGLLNIKRDITASYRLERELATLGTLATATGRARSRAEIAATAIELLCTASGAEVGVIVRFEGDRAVIEAGHGLSDAMRAQVEVINKRSSPLFTALDPPGKVLVGDLDQLPLAPAGRAWLTTAGFAAVAVVGLDRDEELVGALAMAWHDARAPRPSSATLLQASAHVERALENARLVEEITRRAEAEQALLRRVEVLDELTRIGQAVGTADELAERSARLVGEALGASGTAYGLFRADGSGYETTRTIGVSQPIADWLTAAAPTARSAVRRWRAGEGSILERFEPGTVTDETLAMARASGVTAYAAIPIRVDGDLAGGIVAYFDREPDELQVDQTVLDSVARIVGISLANFRHRERFERSEERYRTLFEASPDACLLLTLDGSIVDANSAADGLFGAPVVGHRAAEFLELDEEEGRRLQAMVDRGERTRYHGIGRRADGTRFPRESEATRVRIGDDDRYLVVTRDLTERQRLQAELVQAQKMETVGILVSGVAHELNNPIASIIGLSTLIGRDPSLSADLRESAAMLVDEAQRAGQIVRTFLDFVRSRPPERHPTPVRPLLETVRELQSYSQKSGVEWVIDVEPGLPRVAIDRSQIQQVLINLTSNAIQAILSERPTGRLEISARRAPPEETPGMVRIAVTDDGPGVAASDRTKLFVPFFTTKEPGEGTGLGLPVSFDIVRRHAGSLRFEPAPGGRGARFVIDLPIQPPLVARTGPGTADEVAPSAAASRRSSRGRRRVGGRGTAPVAQERRPRALILDDEESIRTFLRKALAAAGFETIVVADGLTAVSETRNASIDVALVDHRMPGMTGVDTFEAAIAIQPDLAGRWIFMSGDVLNPDLHAFAEARGIALLAKPFDVTTVTRSVRDVVDRLGLADRPAAQRG